MSSSDENVTLIGLDLSTQKLKAIIVSNNNLRILNSAEVHFDTDLPEFRTSGGVNIGQEKNEYFVHPIMWVKAVDIVMDRLLMQGADFSKVIGISGSAQQHGSLYWSRRGIEVLKNLDHSRFLHSQLDDSAFVVTRTPMWMDGSAVEQCQEMETAIGGRDEMIAITGSKSYPRFTGPQIRKVYQQRTHCYEDSQRISLVSSFLASLFIGDIAPIDYADASGMSLFDINNMEWSRHCLNACAPDLEERLGEAVSGNTILGMICDYFVERFGFSPECKVIAFTGDNPSSFCGMLAKPNSLVISLGTSDTMMINLSDKPHLNAGHVMCHPIESDQFIGLLCFRNGSLVRDAVKCTESSNSWEKFNDLLNSTPRGNYGNMAIHFPCMEIIPHAKGVLRWSKMHCIAQPDAVHGVLKFNSPQTEIRALIEGQMLHKRAVAEDMGFKFGTDSKIIATGGASVNGNVLQILADVFHVPVHVEGTSESALMGATYRAKYVLYADERLHEHNDSANSAKLLNYVDYISQFISQQQSHRVYVPNKDSESIYEPMLSRYRDMATILQAAA